MIRDLKDFLPKNLETQNVFISVDITKISALELKDLVSHCILTIHLNGTSIIMPLYAKVSLSNKTQQFKSNIEEAIKEYTRG